MVGFRFPGPLHRRLDIREAVYDGPSLTANGQGPRSKRSKDCTVH